MAWFMMLLSCLIGIPSHKAGPRTSADNVKITYKAEKPADGKRVVFLTIEISRGWHMSAEPVDLLVLEDGQSSVRFTTEGKHVPAKIEYPAPTRTIKNGPPFRDVPIYEGTITIKATLDQTGPVEAIVWLQTVSETCCIPPSKVRLKIE